MALACVAVTGWTDEYVEAAIRFVGQLSGRLVAVEGPRDEEEIALVLHDLARGGRARAFCGRLWLVEELAESDARRFGLRSLPGIESPGWRVWIGRRDYTIWRDARCARRSVKLRHQGHEWWRAQVHITQRRDPHSLWLSDCTRDPDDAPHDDVLGYSKT
jgi:hypothetical protein